MKVATRDELLRTAVAHASELARFFRGRVSDVHDAEDLVQELYLAVLKMRSSQPIRHPKAYLFTVAANLAHQHRQRSKGQPLHITLDEVPATVLQTTNPDREPSIPESAAALAERFSMLRQRLSELSPKVQAAIVWHHRDGYTCDEIGEKLAVVRHRVKKYLVKGMSHCRAAVQ